MALPSTVGELTNHHYNELRCKMWDGTTPKGSYIRTLCDVLDKCGISITSTTRYNLSVEGAVKQFQKKAGLNQTGIVTDSVWQAMVLYSKRMSDSVNDSATNAVTSYNTKSTSPHFTPFFDTVNTKTPRINHQDIKIVFGNKSITKTIKDVFMRSVSVEVDTSGNPISEVYEFIAKDIIESDEINDADKYTKDSHKASSDIKYQFNFGKTE